MIRFYGGDYMSVILNDVKEVVTGFSNEDNSFDMDIIIAINTIFFALYQQNVGQKPFRVNSETTWDDFIKENNNQKNITSFVGSSLRNIQKQSVYDMCYSSCEFIIDLLKQYIITKTRMLFDPPANSTVQKIYDTTIAELEYRINIEFNDYVERG